MATYSMRPRFQFQVPISAEEAVERFKQRLEQQDCPFKGSIRKNHVLLRIKMEDRHFWSPFLDLEFRPGTDDNAEKDQASEADTIAYGVVGPSPGVWTAFMTGYAGLAFLAFVLTILGYSQWSIDHSPWGFYLLPVVLLIFAISYAASFLGQRLAREQTHALRVFIDDVLK